MCGIISYLGDDDTTTLLLKGLKRLEYRGYDSAGITLIDNHNIKTFKAQGHVKNLIKKVVIPNDFFPKIGLAHTR